MNSFKKYQVSILAMILLYIIQFIIFPHIFVKYYPQSNESFAIFIITSMIVIVLSTYLYKISMIQWILSDLIYLLFIWTYPAQGAYGIGLRGISLDGLSTSFQRNDMWIGLIIYLVLLILLQFITKIIIKILAKT